MNGQFQHTLSVTYASLSTSDWRAIFFIDPVTCLVEQFVDSSDYCLIGGYSIY